MNNNNGAAPQNYTGAQFIKALIDHSRAVQKVAWLALFGFLILLIFNELNDIAFYEIQEQYFYAVIWLSFAIAVTAPIYKLSMRGHQVIPVVVIWSLLSLVVTLIFLYSTYFVVTANLAIDWTKPISNGTPPTVDEVKLASIRAQANLLLSVPAVILGVWTAVTGVYASHQTNKKNQKTSNAFSLIMQTRTSAIFVENIVASQMAYPPDHMLSLTDEASFIALDRNREYPRLVEERDRLRNQFAKLTEALDKPPNSPEELQTLKGRREAVCADLDAAELKCVKVKGLTGIRYLLNYYEFMAKGVRSGDLDEELLIGTLRGIVVSLYEDTTELRDYIRNGSQKKTAGKTTLPYKAPQPRVYEHLQWLVDGDEGRPGWKEA